MIYVTSDAHGTSLARFLRLLDRAGFGDADRLFVLGDVIDRNGDGGAAMLRWILGRQNVELLLGNHEKMLLECSFLFEGRKAAETTAQMRAQMLWTRNGAGVTIESLQALGKASPDVLKEILGMLRSAPLYRRVCAGGRECLLVHAGLGNFSPEKKLEDYEPRELLWTRPSPEERYFPDVLTVFGHTPTGLYYGEWGRMFTAQTWVNIDTGAAGGGFPMLLRLEDLQPFYA